MRSIAAMCLALLGCDPTLVVAEEESPAGPSDATAPEASVPMVVVERSGMHLVRAGEPFRFFGVNTYYLAGMTSEGGVCDYHPGATDWQPAVDAYFAAAADVGATVVRFWAFQTYAGPSGDDFTFVERLVAAARVRGIYLIPVLVSQWGDCEPGDAWLPDSFYAAGYLQVGYRPGYTLSFRDYVARITAHFADEPTILMWQLGHDMAMTYDLPDRVAIARAFTADVAAVAKQNAPRTLLGLGTNGMANGGFGEWDYSAYQALHEDPNVDVVEATEITDQFPDLVTDAVSGQLELDWSVALEIGKPFFVYSAGVSQDERADYVALNHAKFVAAAELGFAGYVLRAFVPNEPPQGFAFGNLPADPLGELFRTDRSLFVGAPYPAAVSPLPGCSVRGERGCDQTACCSGLTCVEHADFGSWLCE
jgi:mannan endo-1,4-beta-mannosidase